MSPIYQQLKESSNNYNDCDDNSICETYKGEYDYEVKAYSRFILTKENYSKNYQLQNKLLHQKLDQIIAEKEDELSNWKKIAESF